MKFIRDAHSNAVVNADKSALESYKRHRQYQKKMIDEVDSLKGDIGEMKADMCNIRFMLETIIKKQK